MSDITISPQHSHGTCYITIYKASVTYWTLTKQNEELAEALIASNRNVTETPNMTTLINVLTESCARGKTIMVPKWQLLKGRVHTDSPLTTQRILQENPQTEGRRHGHGNLINRASTNAS